MPKGRWLVKETCSQPRVDVGLRDGLRIKGRLCVRANKPPTVCRVQAAASSGFKFEPHNTKCGNQARVVQTKINIISPVDVGPSVQDICDSLRRGMVEIVVRGEDVSVGVTIAGDICARQPRVSLPIPVRMTQCMFSLTSIEPPLLACHRIEEPVVCADRNNHHHSLAANSINE